MKAHVTISRSGHEYMVANDRGKIWTQHLDTGDDRSRDAGIAVVASSFLVGTLTDYLAIAGKTYVDFDIEITITPGNDKKGGERT